MRFSFDTLSPFLCTRDKLMVRVYGNPLSYKRTGGYNRFDTQKREKKEFLDALFAYYALHGVRPASFGKDDVHVVATFVFARRNGKIPNDVDNLSKFLLDCLQLPYVCDDGTVVKTYDNDNQVLKLCVEKQYGDVPMTQFSITRVPVVIDLTNDTFEI